MAGLFGISQPIKPDSRLRVERVLAWRGSGTPAWQTSEQMNFLVRTEACATNGFICANDAVWIALDGYLGYEPGDPLDSDDTPVLGPNELLDLVTTHQPSSVASHFFGSFALAVYYPRTKILNLVRDHIGSRPLFYLAFDNLIAFGSTIRSLHLGTQQAPALNPQAIDYYIAMITPPDPHTMYQGIYQVPPGHCAIWQAGNLKVQAYWRMTGPDLRQDEDEGRSVARLRRSLEKAVKTAVSTERRVGSFLSGGHDTTVVVGLASKVQPQLKTFTIGFGEQPGYTNYNEFPFAKTVAEKFGTDHYETNITGEEVANSLPEIAWHLDSPSGDAINSFLVSRFAAQQVQVALTGTGGDELFIGSHWYLQLFRLNAFRDRWLAFPKPIRKLMLSAARTMRAAGLYRKLARLDFFTSSSAAQYSHLKCLFKEDERPELYVPAFLQELEQDASVMRLLDGLFAPVQKLDLIRQFMYAFLVHEVGNLQIRDLDVMAYANKVEARSPLLDRRVVEAVARIPLTVLMKNNTLRYAMIAACMDLLPQSTLTRKKMSFIVPMSVWANQELREPITRLLSEPTVARRGVFKPGNVKQILDDFYVTGSERHPFKVWNLALLELWLRVHQNPTQVEPPTDSISAFL